MELGIQEKTALVFGASRGLGLSIAIQLAKEGCNLLLVARTGAALDELASNLTKTHGVVCYCLSLDISSDCALEKLLSFISDAELLIDILVNISGGPSIGTALATKSSEFASFFDSMFGFFIELNRTLGQRMADANWGRIITVTSSGVVKPLPELVISNSLRAALTNWMHTLAMELAPHSVTVNCVVPGRIQTERVTEMDAMRAMKKGYSVAKQAKESQAGIPMQRYGKVHEFASTVAFLASENAAYITASNLRVDGGLVNFYN